MHDAVIVALIAGIPAILGAIGGFIKLLSELKKVHSLVNSHLDFLMLRIDGLEKHIKDLEKRELESNKREEVGLKREEAIATVVAKTL